MDRNDFLQTLLSPSAKKKAAQTVNSQNVELERTAAANPFTTSINPYAGAWTENEIIHLLKRLCFGAPREQVLTLTGLTYSAAVDQLLNTVNTTGNMGEPVKVYSTDIVNTLPNDPDWAVPVGRTWVNTPTNSGSVNSYRRDSIKTWWFNTLINQPASIEEKMILFWSSHFTIEFDTVDTGTLCYDYMKTLRQYALGNLKAFTKAITLNPAMLIYLNGYQNTKTAPDENYGRELQELFTLGKGPLSQYTENDVKAAARVLTGYQVNRNTVSSYFTSSRHDTNPKQFSSFYGNAVINRPIAEAQLEVDDLLNLIFANEEVSMYICRRLYRFFVYDEISTDTETDVITAMAATLRSNNYEIKPVLAQLFKSEHFFDVLQFGAMIKSAADFTVGMIRECKLRLPPKTNPQLLYRHLAYMGSSFMISQEQDLGNPPNVSGFPAYYQTPLFDRLWINTDTFTKRQNLVNTLVNSSYSNGGFKLYFDVVDFARRMSNPADPNQLIVDFNKYLLRRTLTQPLRDSIKSSILLTGQTQDHYWSDAWNAYMIAPENLNNFSVVNTRLKTLASYFLSKLEEYQLM
ncbi:MAG: DUF1800 domain-containing protein [Ferruginibacter sp.]|nr:DUF1800 domain-containing protein [Ferruginibacter sp.]